jgi:hypothetical protein
MGLSYQGYFFGVYWLDPVLALSNSLIVILAMLTVSARCKRLLERQTGAIAAALVKYVIGPVLIAWMLLGTYILGISVRYIPQAIPFLTSSSIRIFVDGYATEVANSFFLGLFYGSLFVPSMPILGSIWVRLRNFVRKWILGTTTHEGSEYDGQEDEFKRGDEFKRLVLRGVLFALLLPLLPTGKPLVTFTTQGNPPIQLPIFTQEIMALFAFVPLVIGLGYHLEQQSAGTKTSAISYYKWLFAALSLSSFVGLISLLWKFSQDVAGSLLASWSFFGAYMTILGASVVIIRTRSWRDRIAERIRWKIAGLIPLLVSPILIRPAVEVMIDWTQANPMLLYVYESLFSAIYWMRMYVGLILGVAVAASVLVFKSEQSPSSLRLDHRQSLRLILAIGAGVFVAWTQTRPIDSVLAFPWRMELCGLLTVLLVVSLRLPRLGSRR